MLGRARGSWGKFAMNPRATVNGCPVLPLNRRRTLHPWPFVLRMLDPDAPGRCVGDRLLEGWMRIRALVLLLVLLGVAATDRTATAQVVTSNSVRLSWTTPGDDSLTGVATQFDLRYSTSAITAANFASATRWTGTPSPGVAGTQQTHDHHRSSARHHLLVRHQDRR